MNTQPMIERLARFPGILAAITSGLPDEDARWRPEKPAGAGVWSVVEVVAHMGDEESLDFGTRVRLTLEDPAVAWPPIDPEGWAIEKHYRDRSLVDEVDRFCRLRGESLAWLTAVSSAGDVPWGNTHEHPMIGDLRAGDVFASWCAHDWLHLRQISKRMYELTGRDAGDYSTRYAGRWGS